MANFLNAYKLTAGIEGGYSNNPSDNGGETWRGVARTKNPTWPGWNIIDQFKRQTGFPAILANSKELQDLVLDLYKRSYWNVLKLDEVANQDIANKLYDICVNLGQSVAAKMLQRTLNVSNQNQKYFPDLIIDGSIGTKTITALNSHPRPEVVFKCLNVLQGQKYIDIAEHNQQQETFINGWFMNRIAGLMDSDKKDIA